MPLQQFFPFIPDHMSWDSWNGNLIMWYSEEAIPFYPEKDWKKTGRFVAQTSAFSTYPVPDPDLFDNWQDWARDVTLIINGPTS